MTTATANPKNGHIPRRELAIGQAVWTDSAGVTHWAIGERLVPKDRGTFCVWTGCGSADVPANSAWYKRPEDSVTCPNCPEHIGTVVYV